MAYLIKFVVDIYCDFVFNSGVSDKLKHSNSYYVTVTAVNMVGKSVHGFSGPVGIDTTPPTYGKVIDLHTTYRINAKDNAATVLMNSKVCTTDEGEYNRFLYPLQKKHI